RSLARAGAGANAAYGVDAALGFFESLNINSYWARTSTPGVSRDDTSYRAQLELNGDRYGAQLERLRVGSHFNPGVGFVRRSDIRRSYGLFRFSPRTRRIRAVRKLSWTGSMTYIEDGAGRVQTRQGDGEFAVEFQNSNRLSLAYSAVHEFLPNPF